MIQSVLDMKQHQWLKGMSKEQAAKIRRFYQKRYGSGKGGHRGKKL